MTTHKGRGKKNNTRSQPRLASRRVLSLQDLHAEIRPPDPEQSKNEFVELARQMLHDQATPFAVLIDDKFNVIYLHGSTAPYFSCSKEGKTNDLLGMVPQGLKAKLRSAVKKSLHDKNKQTLSTQIKRQGCLRRISVSIEPVFENDNEARILLIIFQELDKTRVTAITTQTGIDDLKVNQDLPELTGSFDDLNRINDELRASNDELKLLNSDLASANQQLLVKVNALESASRDISHLLNSTDFAAMHLDRLFCLRQFTPKISQLADLSEIDLGKPLRNEVLKFTDPDILTDAAWVLRNLIPSVREVPLQDGRWCVRRITPFQCLEKRVEGVAITFSDVTPYKISEQAFKRTEDGLRQMLAALNLAHLFLHDLSGRIIHWPAGSVSAYGFSADEAVGDNLDDLLNPRYSVQRENIYRHLLQDGHWQGEIVYQRRDGTDIPVISLWALFRDDAGNPVAIVQDNNDLTASKNAEKQVHLAHLRAELLSKINSSLLTTTAPQLMMENVCVEVSAFLNCAVFFDYQIEPQTRPLHFNAFNGIEPDVTRLLQECDLCAPLSESIIPAPRQVTEESSAITFEGQRMMLQQLGIRAYVAHPLLGPNNEKLGMLSFGATDRDAFNNDDLALTKRVAEQVAIAMLRLHAEESLRRLNNTLEQQVLERTAALNDKSNRLRAILDNAFSAIITIDSNGKIENVNRASERIFGFNTEEMLGQNISLIIPSPYRDRHSFYLQRFRETGEAHIIGTSRELQARRKDGSLVDVALAVSEADYLGRFTGILLDISQRKELEREVLQITAMEQQRIGGYLHDECGQHLTALGLLTGTLTAAFPSRAKESIKIAKKIERGLTDVLRQIRNISRGLVLIEIEPADLLKAMGEMAVRFGETSAVRCVFLGDDRVRVADKVKATHLYHIAQEACNNAVKHSHARTIQIQLQQADDTILLRIIDDGRGFVTDAPAGLGLRIMRHRANVIGANFSIESGQSQGTVVTCRLKEIEYAP